MKSLRQIRWATSVVTAILALTCSAPASDRPYDLARVDGMVDFGGSAAAQKILAKQGFVVAAPEFAQIFQPYIESPLPVIITPDSAWHTYHLLLEKGVKELEERQARSLLLFSKSLLAHCRPMADRGNREFADLTQYAAIGVALQDSSQAAGLNDYQKRLVNGLISGTAGVAAPIGFSLSAVNFRPQSFYTESADLAAYYRARQWYASVDFRLADDHETRLALSLSWLIESDPDLLQLWHGLAVPYDAMLALPEDGTVNSYFAVTKKVLGPKFDLAEVQSHAAQIQTLLRAALPVPQINDQLLGQDDYVKFPDRTVGFRLLPSRQLPCAVSLQNCVYPKIRDRLCPSGLDFFAASAEMRSPASLRAEKNLIGPQALAAVLKADPGPMPHSLYGESLQLLGTLQKPLPARVPAALRSEAWADLQLSTQLAAWAEQRHTWALHAKPAEMFMGLAEPVPGLVEPYPDFFAGLARLTRRTAEVLATNDPGHEFNFQQTATKLRDAQAARTTLKNLSLTNGFKRTPEMAILEHEILIYSLFARALFVIPHPGVTFDKSGFIPDETLQRWIQQGPSNQIEVNVLRLYSDAYSSVIPQLADFASLCDQLATLAAKELAGKPPTPEEARWIAGYGITLAGFHDYEGNSWLEARDDFPILSRIFGIPVNASALYAGLARPQALYVILPYNSRQQLYRGAVLSYREFQRPESEDLTDESWREMVRHTNAPAAPAFTSSFSEAAAPDAAQSNLIRGIGFTARGVFRAPPPVKISLSLKQSEFCARPTPVPLGTPLWIMSSDDERHVANLAFQDGKWRVVHDGIAGKEYNHIETFTFSPDSQHVVYLATDHDGFCLVRDAKEGKLYSKIGPYGDNGNYFQFSPDGAHLAYKATIAPDQQCIVLDDVEGPVFERVINPSFQFSEASNHFAYVARRNGKYCALLDHKVVQEGVAVEDPYSSRGVCLSPDGQHLAFIVRRGSNLCVHLDGIDSKPWNWISDRDIKFSSDSRHFSYNARREGKEYIVLDGNEWDASSLNGAVVFSPNGKHWAILTDGVDGPRAVLDGVSSRIFAGWIFRPTFSPDGSKFAYSVEGRPQSSSKIVTQNGTEIKDFDLGMDGRILYSPDSRHLALLGTKASQKVAVIDGKQYPRDDREDVDAAPFIFSPDSQGWGYPAGFGGKKYWIISGAKYGPYDRLDDPLPYAELGEKEPAQLFFSPDSRHFAYRVTRENRRYLVVDGLEQPVDGEWFPNSAIIFDTPLKFHFLVLGADKIFLVQGQIHF